MTRTCLTVDTFFYVDVNGSDLTGDGTSGNPWLTPQFAIEKIMRNYDMSGYSATLKFSDGNWYVQSGSTTFCSGNGPCVGANANGLTLNLLGNRTNPSNCVINLAAGQYGFAVGNNFIGTIYGFKFVCPTSGGVGAIPFFASNGGSCDFDDIIFGANPYNVNCYAVSKGTLLMLGGTKSAIIGNTPIQFAAEEGGVVKVATNIDIPTALTFSIYALADMAGAFIALTHITYTGAGKNSCTGKKGYTDTVATIRVDGDLTRMLGNVAATGNIA